MPRVREFYRDRLRLRYLFEAGDMAFLNCGGVRLMQTAPKEAEFDHRPSILYFRVEEIDEAFRAVSEHGVHFGFQSRRFVIQPAAIGCEPVLDHVCRRRTHAIRSSSRMPGGHQKEKDHTTHQ